jgi:tetratricopeptide (TPR) repeat protein
MALGGVTKKNATIAIVAFLLLFFSVGSSVAVRTLRYVTEDIRYALDPSAQHAFEIGQRHFDARDPQQYDIERAAVYFYEAQRLDPSYPHINFQLARYHFVQANFEQALARINTEIRLSEKPSAAAYYVRALTLGFMGAYENAARNYEKFLAQDPYNWAGLNDYAWVLIRAGRSADALAATEKGLEKHPDNPWLLNSRATALFEMGQFEAALRSAEQARDVVGNVAVETWLAAYPGNDPNTAAEGIGALQSAVYTNVQKIKERVTASSSEMQVR